MFSIFIQNYIEILFSGDIVHDHLALWVSKTYDAFSEFEVAVQCCP